MIKVLLIEDEKKTAHSIQQGLQENYFDVDLAYDGATGLEKACHTAYEVIVSDIMMPGLNGLELCLMLRKKNITTPVLMLTALGTTDDKVTGLDSGADDYLVKPFEFQELIARIRALSRRNQPITVLPRILSIADLELNLDSKNAVRNGRIISLTAKEFALMEYLMKNAGRVVSKTEIAEKVWDITFDTGTNIIEVYVNYLRNKIDKDFFKKLIHTVHGMGYILKEG